MSEISTKICRTCKKGKTIDKFGQYSRSKDGLETQCKECKNLQSRQYYKTHPRKNRGKYRRAYYLNNRNKISEQNKLKRKTYPLQSIFKTVKMRAQKLNIPCDSFDNLYNYLKPIYNIGKCECCGKIVTQGGNKNDIPSVDRIIPELGYVIGNVAILCGECNRIKSSGTWQQHDMIADWIKERLLEKVK